MLERRRASSWSGWSSYGPGCEAGRERSDAYTRSLMEHDREAAEHDLSGSTA